MSDPAEPAESAASRSGPSSARSATPPGLDLAAALNWLNAQPGIELAPTTSARLITGGRSNLTYLLADGQQQVVLRRPPLGHVLATAHDMSREYRIIRALAETAVPVPAALGLCTDPTVIGAPFYLMTYVDGLVLRADSAALTDLAQADRNQIARSMMTVLADLHEVTVEAAGLTDFGRPAGFVARQLSRWTKQLEASRSRDLPGIDRLRDELAALLPARDDDPGSGCVVHGDYRLDNLLIAPPGTADALGVRAVLDWEMSTLGDPLADLGLLLAYWDVVSALDGAAGVRNIGAAQGFPDGLTLVDWYAGRRNTDLTDLPWFTAFGLFKLAVILEGIHFRFQLGRTLGDDFAGMGAAVPALVDAGLEVLLRSRPSRP